jgi:iron complex outermembrane receptor protein
LGDWEFRTNVAVFQQWYDDIQRAVAEFVPGEGISTVIQNAAVAEIGGAEIEATIAPTRYLSLRLAYAYLDPKYKEWESPSTANPGVILDLSETPFAYIPEHAGSAALLLNLPIGDSAGTLEAQFSYSARSGVYINAFGTADQIRSLPAEVFDTVYQRSFDLVDINLTWANAMGSNLDVTAYVKNATDERYAVGSISQYGNAPGPGGRPAASGLGLNTKVYSDPRTYGAQVRYRF